MISLSSIGRCWRRLARSEQGAVSMLYGFTIFVVFSAAGLGLDYVRAQRTASRATSALDAAALAGAKAMSENPSLNDDQIIDIAKAAFAGNTAAFGAHGVTASVPTVTVNRVNYSVAMQVNLHVPTTLGRVIAIDKIDFPRTSTAIYDLQRVELAMVLDLTGSMNSGGRLPALKLAAKDVLDILLDPNKPFLTRISVVPYSAAVNVGSYADIASGGDSLDGCVMERLYAPERDSDHAPGYPNNYAVNGQLNSPTNGRYVCLSSAIKPLADATELANLKTYIDGFTAAGWTAGHIGLAWGWNTISDRWTGVFTGASAPGSHTNPRITKAILLMTDGDFNTSYTAGTSTTDQTTESMARTNALCAAIKAQNIKIFSVAFLAPTAAETLLQNCASSPVSEHYFDAANETQLRNAFKSIAGKLQNLRLSN